MKHITIDPSDTQSPLRDHHHDHPPAAALPHAKEVKLHPSHSGGENASIYFVGTATTILEWEGLRLMTDPNFLHAGDHVHLGPGVTGTRQTDPAVDLHDLPPISLVLLSHYHADHFDQKVEASLRRDLPIISTPHAKKCLVDDKEKEGEGEKFTAVESLDFWESLVVNIGAGEMGVKVTGMPGKHVPDGVLGTLNDLVGAVPPTNGWMVELGRSRSQTGDWECNYRIYISGDTLLVDDLKQIPERYKGQNIDLMLVHLGGTTIPSPSMPLLMVTMNAEQGLGHVRLINPDLTIPIHYDDYDVFLSPLSDFKKVMDEAGLSDKVVYLDRGDQFRFKVQGQA
ncbi:hypothetical protein MMC19_007458 [Ptychographa xylographoides]|nr:hypothetical protein [Ptychographa xylographoides]